MRGHSTLPASGYDLIQSLRDLVAADEACIQSLILENSQLKVERHAASEGLEIQVKLLEETLNGEVGVGESLEGHKTKEYEAQSRLAADRYNDTRDTRAASFQQEKNKEIEVLKQARRTASTAWGIEKKELVKQHQDAATERVLEIGQESQAAPIAGRQTKVQRPSQHSELLCSRASQEENILRVFDYQNIRIMTIELTAVFQEEKRTSTDKGAEFGKVTDQ
ncbi:hypothetical protein LZ554_008050 [Drepanopeziza brunnea f. sp. 'monogermtubi']|nr:hypothetical protein LZ554_008050 [Drepanopeziza brunnea f. sp. 'monogermtubi']